MERVAIVCLSMVLVGTLLGVVGIPDGHLLAGVGCLFWAYACLDHLRGNRRQRRK